MRLLVHVLILLATGLCWASDAVIKDGDTLKLGTTLFRLEGVDAPELDQICLDEHRAEWTCGIAARDALNGLVGNRAVNCHDNGPAPGYPDTRLGICWVTDEPVSLNQQLVRGGWALNFDPKRSFTADQEQARENRRGLWKGCFVAPWDLRNWRKDAAKLLGPACGDLASTRDRLFPDQIEMPPGCPIKGQVAVRARALGYRGIYHLENCVSYSTTRNPNRWFCSEEDAKAAGFRKSYRC
jgi:endonuclease YncB( thermonuclease family)